MRRRSIFSISLTSTAAFPIIYDPSLYIACSRKSAATTEREGCSTMQHLSWQSADYSTSYSFFSFRHQPIFVYPSWPYTASSAIASHRKERVVHNQTVCSFHSSRLLVMLFHSACVLFFFFISSTFYSPLFQHIYVDRSIYMFVLASLSTV